MISYQLCAHDLKVEVFQLFIIDLFIIYIFLQYILEKLKKTLNFQDLKCSFFLNYSMIISSKVI